ncbi:MAG: chromate efflux transporter [Bacteroidetes bacterium]|nr:chromate efflux transporter [Bacteroidota bacterium]
MKGVQPTLAQLFLVFLKIGATAFGGNVALVAAVRNEICRNRGWLSEERLLDTTTLGNLLPGPLAVNVVAALGFQMRGLAGALVCMTGVLLPALVLVCALSAWYFRYGSHSHITVIFNSMLPAVAAVIMATVWQLFQKNATTWLQRGMVLLAAAALLLSRSFLTTLLVITAAGFAGWLFMRKDQKPEPVALTKRSLSPVLFASVLAVVAGVLVLIQLSGKAALIRQLALTFGSMSITLFGGGYVFVPVIRDVVVEQLQWVTNREFFDGIAIGQVTPGPIMISAAFIGWKQAGISGALASTAGIFLPPAALMLIATQFTERLRGNAVADAIFRGVRPAVIGMIAASVFYIARSGPLNWQAAVIFAAVLLLSLRTKISQAVLVPASGLLGWLLYTLF